MVLKVLYDGLIMPQKYPSEEIGRRGQKLYDEQIRQHVEPVHVGKVVMIDVDTGDHLVGTDPISLSDAFRRRDENAALYAMRIGERAFAKLRSPRPVRRT